MSDGLVAHGATLTFNSEVVGELTNIDGLEINVKEVDFSNHDNEWDEFKPGRISVSDLNIEGNYVAGDAGQAALYAAGIARSIVECEIAAPDGSYSWTFYAFVKKFKTGHPDGDKVKFTGTLKVTDEVTHAVSASNDLSGLSPSVGTLTGPLTAGQYDYVVPVITGTTSITITPTASLGVITVNGVVVTSGQASGSIALGAAGSVTEIIVKVKETGKVAKKYVIWVARAAA